MTNKMNKIQRTSFYCFILFCVFFTYSCQRVANPNPKYLYPTYSENQPDVKVRIAKHIKQANIQIKGSFEIRTYFTEEIIGSGQGGLEGNISIQNKMFMICNKPMDLKRMRIISPNPITINGITYDYEIHLIQRKKGFDIINKIKLEHYLAGVLGSEMPITWPDEALKAQAVASRTYALFQMKIHENRDFHLENSTASQVFGGRNTNIRANRIIAETAGLIMVFNWKLFPAYFHSSSGGYCADASIVFKNYLPALHGRPDPDSPPKPWHAIVTNSDIIRAIKKTRPKSKLGRIKSLEIISRTPSGRVQEIAIVHTLGTEQYSGNAFRLAIGANKIKSSLYSITQTNQGYSFTGKGYGHGIGMSQWGCLVKAKKQIDYQQILRYYYPGIDFIKVYKTTTL